MIRRTLPLAVAALVTVTCTSLPPLAHTSPSSEAAATALLEALAAKDQAALAALVLSESEFKDHVWPQLPAARPERNLPFSYVWGDLHQKSVGHLSRTLASHGGKRYTLVSTAFTGVTDYGTYTVHRNASFTVRDEAGQTLTLSLCGSMIEKDGGWKVFSYVVD